MNKPEIYLGNWGTIVCENEAHREYLRAAKRFSELRAATCSWAGAWLNPTMEAEYMDAEAKAKVECDNLWEAIPGKENLIKSH